LAFYLAPHVATPTRSRLPPLTIGLLLRKHARRSIVILFSLLSGECKSISLCNSPEPYLAAAAGGRRNAVTNKNRIVIYGPKPDDTYVIEFETADGQTLAISMPHGEWAVLKYFQERMPYGLFVPDIS